MRLLLEKKSERNLLKQNNKLMARNGCKNVWCDPLYKSRGSLEEGESNHF